MTRQTPFQRLLGADFDRLPAPLRDLHGLSETAFTAGHANITMAASPLSWLLCWIAGLPRQGRDVPVTVAFHPDGKGGEWWERHFASRRYASTIAAGTGRYEGFLIEYFGPLRLITKLTPDENGLGWSLERRRFLGHRCRAGARRLLNAWKAAKEIVSCSISASTFQSSVMSSIIAAG